MKFTINLFDASLLPAKIRYSFKYLLQISSAIIIVGCVALIMCSWLVSRQEHELQQVKQIQRQLNNKQQQLEAELAKNKADPRLVAQVDLAKSRIKLKQMMLNELDRRNEINKQGFSALLSDLGHVASSNLWLDRIYIKDDALSFEGYSLNAQNVPLWVESLKTTKTLKGFSFAAMTMNRGENKPLAFLLTSLPLSEKSEQGNAQ